MSTIDEINADELLGRLTRLQAHAARALLDQCPYCPDPDCSGDQRWDHERLDAANEAVWWRRSKGVDS